MTTARLGAVAAPLPDGRVLVAGGFNAGALESAELFNPQTGAFTALSNVMGIPRQAAAAAPLPDGRVLIVGGHNSGDGDLQTAQAFDPATGAFAALAHFMSTARVGPSAAPLPDGQVLIVGGVNSVDSYLSSAEVFNPQTDTFTTLSNSMTTAREEPAVAPLPDGRVLIAGGTDGTVLSSAEVFDPKTDTFTALPNSMTTPRVGAGAAPLPDGRVLIAGGNDGVDLSSAEVFDPQSGEFTALSGSMTAQRLGPATAGLPDGRVLLAGGDSLSSADVFEPAPEAVAAGGKFGAQTISESSPSQTIVITNLGAQALQISGATVAGANAGDFAVSADRCSERRLAFEQSCTVETSFTPTASGARTAQLQLTDNEPTASTVTLSGSGVAANSGPAGPQGLAGAQGAPGARGPAGAAGKIRLVTCKTVTKTVKRHGRKHKVHQRKCSTRLVTGSITFTTTAARATLTRRGIVYATGSARLNRLTLHTRRTVRHGRYTLILRHRNGHHWIATRHEITVT